MKTKNNVKTIAIVTLASVVLILLGVIVNLKRSYDRKLYAIANNCEWVATGTMYGDDRDFICK